MPSEERQDFLRDVSRGMDDARERFQQAHRAFERFEHSHDPGDSSALKDRLGDLLGTLHEVERLTHLLEDSLHGEAAGPGRAR